MEWLEKKRKIGFQHAKRPLFGRERELHDRPSGGYLAVSNPRVCGRITTGNVSRSPSTRSPTSNKRRKSLGEALNLIRFAFKTSAEGSRQDALRDRYPTLHILRSVVLAAGTSRR